MYLSPSHFVCHRDPSSWALGSVHRTRLYTSEFFSSVSTCGKKSQNPLSPTFCPRTYFFTFVVHTRIYLILQQGWSSFLLSGFTVVPLPASVGSILWPYSLETAPPVWDSLQSGSASPVAAAPVGNQLTKPPPSLVTPCTGGEIYVECHRIRVARNSKEKQATLHST